MSKNTRTRILLVAVAALLLVTMAVGGTLAWLQASSNNVINTFTGSSLNITMKESPLKTGEDYDGKTIDTSEEDVEAEENYKMVPGVTLQKDPYAIVTKGSEPCYVFVVITESENFSTFMDWHAHTTASGDGDVAWTKVTGYKNVFMYNNVVNALNAEQTTTSVLDWENAITVKNNVDTTALSNLTEDTYPTLTFKAYAIQSSYLVNAAGEAVIGADAIWSLTGLTNVGEVAETN